jgi:hypothetical protein
LHQQGDHTADSDVHPTLTRQDRLPALRHVGNRRL